MHSNICYQEPCSGNHNNDRTQRSFQNEENIILFYLRFDTFSLEAILSNLFAALLDNDLLQKKIICSLLKYVSFWNAYFVKECKQGIIKSCLPCQIIWKKSTEYLNSP